MTIKAKCQLNLKLQLLIRTYNESRDSNGTESALWLLIDAREPFPSVMSLFSLAMLTWSGLPSNFIFCPKSLFRNSFIETPLLFIIKMWLLSSYDRIFYQNVCTCIVCSSILDPWLSLFVRTVQNVTFHQWLSRKTGFVLSSAGLLCI